MVSDAAATKAPIAKIADKVSGVFVPVVLVIALFTFIIWSLLGMDLGLCGCVWGAYAEDGDQCCKYL